MKTQLNSVFLPITPLQGAFLALASIIKVKIQRASRVLVIALFALLAGCSSYQLNQAWPADIPDRQLFIDGYLKKRNLDNASPKQLSYHLGWIKRFYQGTTIYPNGWLNASKLYVDSIEDSAVKKSVDARLANVGVDIANEWAQDNDVRLINSNTIATWGSAMKTAAQRNEHEDFLTKVEKDVVLINSGTLSAKEVKYRRYFEEEDYDDF